MPAEDRDDPGGARSVAKLRAVWYLWTPSCGSRRKGAGDDRPDGAKMSEAAKHSDG
jgi:hypothetical protein